MDLSELDRLEKQVRTMKLSDAIRIGAKLRQQCTGDYFERGRSCALGAAWEGSGGIGRPGYEDICGRFGISWSTAEWVARKNDNGWTREAIANWLAEQGL